MKTSRSFYKTAIIVTLILCAAIAVGVPLYRYALPEPASCALCEHRELHRAPVLMNLATGEIVELSVEPRTGVFRLVVGAWVLRHREHPDQRHRLGKRHQRGGYLYTRYCFMSI